MGYEFVTGCGTCGKDFTFLWVLDQMRVGPQSVAKITCPACGIRFYQKFSDLVPFKVRGIGFLTGRHVRTMELIYDCPSCGMRGSNPRTSTGYAAIFARLSIRAIMRPGKGRFALSQSRFFRPGTSATWAAIALRAAIVVSARA